MDRINANQINFIKEQDGIIEREFKTKLDKVFIQADSRLRAYIMQVQYIDRTDISVALCIKIDNDFDENNLKKCAHIFNSTFSSDQHLDIVFISDSQEREIRLLGCPFFTSCNDRVVTPDFYLFSNETYDLGDQPRKCYKRKRLYGDHVDGYMLCDIDPILIGQSYGLGSNDIDQLIIASRFEGMSLFPISEWPTYVHVARPLIQNINLKTYIEKGDSQLIGWAEIYKEKNKQA